jgi:hypothetical protein
MHEILCVLGESVLIYGVSIDPLSSQVSRDPNNDGYLIRIKCDMTDYSEKCLNPVLEKHGLILRQNKGYIVISP